MRFKLISCDIFTREVCSAVWRAEHTVDVEFLPKGLHDIGSKGMLQRLQETLNNIDETFYSAVLFGYGLCNLGVVGLTSRTLPLIIPRAHDCITLFLGSRRKYEDYFNANPGTYFLTSGWVERGEVVGELAQQSVQHRLGMDKSLDELVAKYGEEDGLYLFSEMSKWSEQYRQITYIEMGVEPDDRFKMESQRRAFERNWQFEQVQGDVSMIQRLVDGTWSEDEFLVVPPHHRVIATYDDNIVGAWALDETERLKAVKA